MVIAERPVVSRREGSFGDEDNPCPEAETWWNLSRQRVISSPRSPPGMNVFLSLIRRGGREYLGGAGWLEKISLLLPNRPDFIRF